MKAIALPALTLDGFDSRRGPYGAALPGGGVNVIDGQGGGIGAALLNAGLLTLLVLLFLFVGMQLEKFVGALRLPGDETAPAET